MPAPLWRGAVPPSSAEPARRLIKGWRCSRPARDPSAEVTGPQVTPSAVMRSDLDQTSDHIGASGQFRSLLKDRDDSDGQC